MNNSDFESEAEMRNKIMQTSRVSVIILRSLLVMAFFGVLIGIIAYARGYRLNVNKKILTSTGIVSVGANQKASKVYVNGELKGVTDINLTLPPGQYKIELKKEGYSDWSKNITLKGEIVMAIDGSLYPKNPSLAPLTNLGIIKAIRIEQTNKILLFTQNNDPLKDGIYVFDPDRKPLNFFPPLQLLILKSALPTDIDFKNTDVIFSPDSTQGIFNFIVNDTVYSYLLSLNNLNSEAFDVSTSKDALITAWQEKKTQNVSKVIETFPKEIRKVASDSFHIIGFSQDEDKVLYKAKQNATIPLVINPPLIGANQTPEERNIKQGKIYVYDMKEDKNFPIPVNAEAAEPVDPALKGYKTITPTPTPTDQESLAIDASILWYPDSRHVIVHANNEIFIYDYDGTNMRTIYSGPSENNFFSVTDAGELLTLINLNPQNNKYPDLYEVGIK